MTDVNDFILAYNTNKPKHSSSSGVAGPKYRSTTTESQNVVGKVQEENAHTNTQIHQQCVLNV